LPELPNCFTTIALNIFPELPNFFTMNTRSQPQPEGAATSFSPENSSKPSFFNNGQILMGVSPMDR
jgi:hypothetical protein